MIKKYSKQSFTLIELLVSISILTVVILTALSIYIKVIGTRQKTLGQLNIQEDGQYLMSLIVKDIRAGIIDYTNYGAISSPEDKLLLLNLSGDHVRYRISTLTPITDGSCDGDRCTLERCESDDCTAEGAYQTITIINISVERLDFYISPTSDPFTAESTTYIHPRVTVVLKLKSLIEKTGEKEIILQQTVPQKYTYRK